MSQGHGKIMFVRLDDGAVEGVFKTDGYVDARKFSPEDIAAFIQERVKLISRCLLYTSEDANKKSG